MSFRLTVFMCVLMVSLLIMVGFLSLPDPKHKAPILEVTRNHHGVSSEYAPALNKPASAHFTPQHWLLCHLGLY